MGPLAGIKIIEMKGIGPGPYAGMLLADLGAEVIVVERSSKTTGIAPPSHLDINSRGKKSIALDLKNKAGIETLMTLVEQSDVIFEGFRPGVAERLGFGPEACLQANPKIIYGRMTGWGQTGPLSTAAGHDINYISITGALAAIGRADKPVPPLNLVGDYAGGSLFLVLGILAALLETKTSGKGQVIDTAITDGSASLMSMFHTLSHLGGWSPQRESNFLDGSAPFYDAYETADKRFISIGAIEPQFWQLLIEKADVDPQFINDQHDRQKWPAMKEQLAAIFKTKTRDEWTALLEGSDTCFAPILDYEESPSHPHNIERQTYIDIGGVTQPAPAPRFSRTQCGTPIEATQQGSDTKAVLKDFGISDERIQELDDLAVLT